PATEDPRLNWIAAVDPRSRAWLARRLSSGSHPTDCLWPSLPASRGFVDNEKRPKPDIPVVSRRPAEWLVLRHARESSAPVRRFPAQSPRTVGPTRRKGPVLDRPDPGAPDCRDPGAVDLPDPGARDASPRAEGISGLHPAGSPEIDEDLSH